ncbi:hypothetical protein Tco_1014650, partial [Tanacetum coccineum]
MGRDTIQLEDAVSTISEEYLLEFTSEYGIPESLHHEFPGPEEPIVEFPEGKVGVYTKFFEFANYHERIFPTVVEWRTNAPKDKMPSADSYSAADVTTLDTHRTPIQKQPELLLCLCSESCQGKDRGPRAAHEVPLLTVTVSRVIDMEDTVVA